MTQEALGMVETRGLTAAIEAADQIVVLADGIVAEKGNHETLMEKRGLYRKLVDLQTESVNWKLS